MSKAKHEFRDPIHTFIEVSSDERAVIDSRPFQRLRHIHQLALTYLVYPGATHRRFEHSLGVMEVATRIFDRLLEKRHSEEIRDRLSLFERPEYWRRALRMAALCHDVGHLPFSHAAEDELLPSGWDHERLTVELIQSDEMKRLWRQMKLLPEDIAKLAVGPKKWKGDPLDADQTFLSEIITSDTFGADRIDYLLRDSFHIGVAYGRFDHHRLIHSLCILPVQLDDRTRNPTLGVEEGGLQSAEALLMARYFMFSQVYLHRVRRIYDIHLKDFLREHLGERGFPTEVEKLLEITDNEVNTWMAAAARNPGAPGHDAGRRIVERSHFKAVYQRHPEDDEVHPDAGGLVGDALAAEFGAQNVRRDQYTGKRGGGDFPVLWYDGEVTPAARLSAALHLVPTVKIDSVFVTPELSKQAEAWLARHKRTIIRPPGD